MSQPGATSDHHRDADFETWCGVAEPELRRLAYLLTGAPTSARRRVLAALLAARSADGGKANGRDEAALRQLTDPPPHPDSSAAYRVVQAGDSQTNQGDLSPDQRQEIVWDVLSTMSPRLRAAVVLDVYAARGDLVDAADATAGSADLAAVLLLPVPAARELTAQTLTAWGHRDPVEPTTYADVVRAVGHRDRRRWRVGALVSAATIAVVGLGAAVLPSLGFADPAPLPEPTTVSDEQESTAFDPDSPYPPPWVAPPDGESEPISSKTKFTVVCARRADAEFRSRTVVRAGCKSVPRQN